MVKAVCLICVFGLEWCRLSVQGHPFSLVIYQHLNADVLPGPICQMSVRGQELETVNTDVLEL
jgi:hypothetical protein